MTHHVDLTGLHILFKDPVRVHDWITLYLEKAPDQYERLVGSFERNDVVGLLAIAHDLRPQAHYLGAARMLELLVDLGHRAREEGANACKELVSELVEVGQQVEEELRIHLNAS